MYYFRIYRRSGTKACCFLKTFWLIRVRIFSSLHHCASSLSETLVSTKTVMRLDFVSRDEYGQSSMEAEANFRSVVFKKYL